MRIANDRAAQEARGILNKLVEPKLNWSLGTLGLVGAIDVDEDTIRATVKLITDDPDQIEALREQAREALRFLGRRHVYLLFSRVNLTIEGVGGIGKVILVGSGKGGVGKSSVASNLAVAMHGLGLRVGLMDADVYGPSVPTMFGAHAKPEILPDEYLMPVTAHGIKTMSVGYLVAPNRALDWRGQLIAGTLVQFIRKTFWGELDALVVDLPPGTGDAQLTLAHKLKADGLLAVTTPQRVALCDVRRAIDFYQRRQVPILGLVENMAYIQCDKCDNHIVPFPAAQAADHNDPAAEAMEMPPTLAQLPLSPEISADSDRGAPVALRGEADPIAAPFWRLARAVCERVGLQGVVAGAGHTDSRRRAG